MEGARPCGREIRMKTSIDPALMDRGLGNESGPSGLDYKFDKMGGIGP